MVKIVVKFKILEGQEENYLRDIKLCILATRQEPGCLEYTAFWNAEERVAHAVRVLQGQRRRGEAPRVSSLCR